MINTRKKLYIVGVGVGRESLLTNYAKNVVNACEFVISTGRIASCFSHAKPMVLKDIYANLETNKQDVACVLVSGDAGFFSISKALKEKFEAEYEIEIVNGISSIQFFAAKLLTTYDDAKIVSMHGRDCAIVANVCYNPKVFVLTGGEFKAHIVCKLLTDSGLGQAKVSIGENLSYENERILVGTAETLQHETFEDLAVMLVENQFVCNQYKTLKDADFIRGESPMTKEEVRTIVVSKLDIKPTDVVFDVGAGTGSVTIEMAKKACSGYVCAIEKNDYAVELIKQNIAKHGTYNINITHGIAPLALENLPTPDAVFVGGSTGNLGEIINYVYAKNPLARFVVTSVTLQTLNELATLNLPNMETVCVNVARAKRAGNYDLMIAQNPVYIVTF